MISVDNMPFCTPEKRGFKKFVKTLQPLYKLPSEKTRETVASLLKATIRKFKLIVAFFKRSEAASTVLCDMQKSENNSPSQKILIQEVRTRWNSLYEMVASYLKIHETVSRAIRKINTDKSSKARPPKDLAIEEVESLMEVQTILKPFFLVTQELCSQKHVTVSKIIPLLKILNNVSKVHNSCELVSFFII